MPYRGVIIEESLVDTSVLDELNIIETEVEEVTEGFKTPWLKQWTLRTVEIPDDRAEEVAAKIAASIDPDHVSSWFADFENDVTHYVIFRDKVFKVDKTKPEEYVAVQSYALSMGIPAHQLGFIPKI